MLWKVEALAGLTFLFGGVAPFLGEVAAPASGFPTSLIQTSAMGLLYFLMYRGLNIIESEFKALRSEQREDREVFRQDRKEFVGALDALTSAIRVVIKEV